MPNQITHHGLGLYLPQLKLCCSFLSNYFLILEEYFSTLTFVILVEYYLKIIICTISFIIGVLIKSRMEKRKKRKVKGNEK